jgi:hypothetical protein
MELESLTQSSSSSGISQPQTILPLVRRHAEDAGFYWNQLQQSEFSYLLRPEKEAHFEALLKAHLNGLRVADATDQSGWRCALENYQRWKGPSEVFVCYVLALESAERHTVALMQDRMQKLWAIFSERHEICMPGLIGALIYVDQSVSDHWLTHWIGRDDYPLLEQAALETYAQRAAPVTFDVMPILHDELPYIRAAGCKLVGKLSLTHCEEKLAELVSDNDWWVENAAAIALFDIQGRSTYASNALITALQKGNALAEKKTGFEKAKIRKSCDNLARLLGHASNSDDKKLPSRLKNLPTRQAILALAHHGDPASVTTLLALMGEQPYAEHSRLAAWAIHMVCDVDWVSMGFTIPTPSEQDSDARIAPLSDVDSGLPWPNTQAIAHWWEKQRSVYSAREFYLLGKSVRSLEHLENILISGTRVERWAAQRHLVASAR